MPLESSSANIGVTKVSWGIIDDLNFLVDSDSETFIVVRYDTIYNCYCCLVSLKQNLWKYMEKCRRTSFVPVSRSVVRIASSVFLLLYFRCILLLHFSMLSIDPRLERNRASKETESVSRLAS